MFVSKHLARLVKSSQGQTLWLIMEIVNYGRNKFYDTGCRLKKLARDKHSSLLRKSVNYGRKKFYSTIVQYFEMKAKVLRYKLIFQPFLLTANRMARNRHQCRKMTALGATDV